MENVLHAGMGGIEMSEWIEYTGGDEQLTELLTTDSKFMVDNEWSVFHKPTRLNLPVTEDNLNWLAGLLRDTKVKKYLICQPHPYADLIKIWADTGCPVWIKELVRNYTFSDCFNNKFDITKTNTPDWNIPGAEYRLTPFED